jgi:hypothetical protein
MRMAALGAFLLLAQFPYLDSVPAPPEPARVIPFQSSSGDAVYDRLLPPEAPDPETPQFAVIEVG